MTPTPQREDLTAARKELALAIRSIMPLTSIEVQNDQGYAVADGWLNRIRDARKMVKARMAKILDPLKEALLEAKHLNAEMDGPLEEREEIVRSAMKEYKLEEHRRLMEAQREQEEKERAALKELEDKRRAEEHARTKKMRDTLAAQIQELEERASVASMPVYIPPVRVAHSTSRIERKCRVVDEAALLRAYAAPGSILPRDIFIINAVAINRHFKAAASEVEKWPGVEGYDDVVVVGGR